MTDQLYRHLSECPGCRASLGRCTSGIREKGAIACCPDCKHEVPVEFDCEAMETYLHATIYTARREEAMLDRDAIKWIVAQLIVCGVGGDLAGLVWRSFDG